MKHDQPIPMILIGVPVKNCGRFIPGLAQQILQLTMPRRQLSVCFYENDSDDDSYQRCLSAKERLENAGITCAVKQGSFGFRMPHTDRHLPHLQPQRLRCLRQVRQAIVDECVRPDISHVMWIDADFVRLPPNLLESLVAADFDGVIPRYVVDGTGANYDWTSSSTDGLNVHQLFHQGRTQSIVEMMQINAASLIKAQVYRHVDYHGHALTPAKRLLFMPPDEEQEGVTLSRAMRLCGMRLALRLDVEVVHAAVRGIS